MNVDLSGSTTSMILVLFMSSVSARALVVSLPFNLYIPIGTMSFLTF
jgi:hypothetical protein